MELVQANPDGGRRLVLGFDAGCMACSQVAERIGKASEEKLETMSLSDPRMTEWRGRALGEDAPWAPTLVEVGDGKVRAWTGVRMGARLARSLGPAATWKVARVLGEMRGSGGTRHSTRSALTRSQFLTGLGGAVVGMSVLSGTGSLTSAATAAEEHWLSRLSISSSTELSRKQAAVAWARLTRGRHLRGLLSSRVVGEDPTASRLRAGILSTAGTDGASQSAATIKGVRHEIKGGGQLLALVYQEGDALVVSYRFDKPGQKTRQFSRMLEDESEELVRVVAEAEDGDVFAAPQDADGRGEVPLATRGRSCTSTSQCPGTGCYGCRCTYANKKCLFNCCVVCALSCRPTSTLGGCLACAVIWCPLCAAVNRCCYRKRCVWNGAC